MIIKFTGQSSLVILMYHLSITMACDMAVAQSVRAFASPAEGWVFESQPRHTLGEKNR